MTVNVEHNHNIVTLKYVVQVNSVSAAEYGCRWPHRQAFPRGALLSSLSKEEPWHSLESDSVLVGVRNFGRKDATVLQQQAKTFEGSFSNFEVRIDQEDANVVRCLRG
jgi:hypothetical protein